MKNGTSFKNKRIGKNEEAVSPVIGVILMVAITVILAAVIAAFVFGMGTPANAPKASLQVTQAAVSSNNITIAHNGGDTIDLSRVEAVIDGNSSSHEVISQLSTSTIYLKAGDVLRINTSIVTGNVYITNSTCNPCGLSNGATNGQFPLSAGPVTVTLIDLPSSQQISKITVSAI